MSAVVEIDLSQFPIGVPKDRKSCGYVYGIEMGDWLKVGCTRRPHKRLSHWLQQINNFGHPLGRACLSPPHLRHFGSENRLHKRFSICRHWQDTELFRISIDDLSDAIEEMNLRPPSLDEMRAHQKPARDLLCSMKRMLGNSSRYQALLAQAAQDFKLREELIDCLIFRFVEREDVHLFDDNDADMMKIGARIVLNAIYGTPDIGDHEL